MITKLEAAGLFRSFLGDQYDAVDHVFKTRGKGAFRHGVEYLITGDDFRRKLGTRMQIDVDKGGHWLVGVFRSLGCESYLVPDLRPKGDRETPILLVVLPSIAELQRNALTAAASPAPDDYGYALAI